jgi:hypothetical protein
MMEIHDGHPSFRHTCVHARYLQAWLVDEQSVDGPRNPRVRSKARLDERKPSGAKWRAILAMAAWRSSTVVM